MTQQLPIIGEVKNKTLLTASQKEFNRLISKINKLQTEAKSFEDTYNACQARASKELQPLHNQYNEYRAEMVELFDRTYDNKKLMARERKKLQEIILQMCQELISEYGMVQLKPIYNKHSDSDYDEVDAEVDGIAADFMRSFVEQMMGMNIPDDVDVSTPEKMEAYMREQLAQQKADTEERQRKAQEKRAQKPKTAKQLEQEQKRAEKEKKKAEEEAKISKSVREVYLDLVKAFHPDLETDPVELQRKTEIMQRITAAYEQDDLLTLLQLQLEFERIDQDHLENLAEDRLKHFNKVLRAQAKELEERMWSIKMQLSEMLNIMPYHLHSPHQLVLSMEKEIKEIKKAIKEVKQDLKDYQDIEAVKAWLKSIKISKPKDDMDDFLSMFR